MNRGYISRTWANSRDREERLTIRGAIQSAVYGEVFGFSSLSIVVSSFSFLKINSCLSLPRLLGITANKTSQIPPIKESRYKKSAYKT